MKGSAIEKRVAKLRETEQNRTKLIHLNVEVNETSTAYALRVPTLMPVS